ncbi:hypothetical protein NV379_04300 [Paenibacillus sp. N1-5-1-14]|uniref:hypothetical protein n=1 Tax=Paenibacillus radicibacter TaxID=2972488 RepID=UPI0021599DFE|nr:hypothetical protein [Paenibacillus radicibacter]MCR8641873.1 hypothetical protein [Paenibacillus radicibacter]
MKRTGSTFFLFLCLLMIVGCGNSKSIVGLWERNDGSVFNGMQVQVEKLDSGEYRGIIIKLGAQKDFKENDTKWKDIKKIKENGFDFVDLGVGAKYDMHMMLSENGESLKMRNLTGSEEIGSEQAWKRISK